MGRQNASAGIDRVRCFGFSGFPSPEKYKTPPHTSHRNKYGLIIYFSGNVQYQVICEANRV
jgi:hypothetical protein